VSGATEGSPATGQAVEADFAKGAEAPAPTPIASAVSDAVTMQRLFQDAKQGLIRQMLALIGDDPSRPGLLETPSRVTKAWGEWFEGYGTDPDTLFKVFEDGAPGPLNNQMVLETNIPIFSWCEHHMAPIVGVAHVAYIPTDKVVGLSKLVRVVNAYAKRLQIQERLTNQVADCIQRNLSPLGVGVVITAEHFCMCTRGVHVVGVKTTTSALRGCIMDEMGARQEFFNLIAMTK
jgi:GTP cyclohydrolase I